MAIAGYAMGATVGYNYLRGEFHHEPFEHFEAALKEAYAVITSYSIHYTKLYDLEGYRSGNR